MEISRGDIRQMVRAVRAGSSWEQVRAAWPKIDPAWLDEHLKDDVLAMAGTPPVPAVIVPTEVKAKKKG